MALIQHGAKETFVLGSKLTLECQVVAADLGQFVVNVLFHNIPKELY